MGRVGVVDVDKLIRSINNEIDAIMESMDRRLNESKSKKLTGQALSYQQRDLNALAFFDRVIIELGCGEGIWNASRLALIKVKSLSKSERRVIQRVLVACLTDSSQREV